MTKFDEATRAIRVDETTYDVCLDDGYSIGGPLNGGYLLAVILRAAVDASPHEHPVSTSAQFLRVPKPGPARVHLEQLKAGRTAAMTRATLVQDGTSYIDTLITTATLTAAEPDYTDAPPVPLPPEEECLALPAPKPENNMTFNAQIDLRFDPPTIGWLTGEPTGRPESRAYFRMAEPQDPDPYVLALAVDALPPVVFSAGARGWAPTVELTWYLRALPAPGPLALYGSGRLISDGWFDEEVEVRDSTGRLVAQSRQLARLGRG
ncbi:acyl-coenzyme A thioesterase PaaI-like protein [Thermocatellispora tengchongensis]|uniref:Acyl-coenzyme A thioesterase PaaI-like protein n=1 Tax=Thermocatellispora tengchongensis TaxID=1073253 RepID=A0A840PJT0_9ACTN|nr:thioesterase family protein [Thermocatellispora tengchongensis]MBB5138173.1 acyl-coenzyme A thioesterase PaaI-like protein [Thermocatellispora tengchongensis]